MRLSLERLYDEHAQSIYAFLLNFTRHEQDARDVMQEVFCKVAAKPSLLDGARDERALLLRLAHNLTVDLARRREARERKHGAFGQEENDAVCPAADSADEEELQRMLAEAFEELPPEQRAVAHLKLYQDATFERIGEALRISANTAASRYRYAIDKLRARLRLLYEEMRNR